ncbi:(2Fe-2S) ferredoxin domain-containing protein [Microbacterium sp. SA39]|uniref:(2Fe-2S) ferredoxin domain-containing protein n=1 Tax=Microbacterium sp. SA39 TaxID=1263625 RepID=UPI0005FA23D9|nr:(2Fe-2S) ferredoxin domain-containing protein [Microbacterium sp. SA39]
MQRQSTSGPFDRAETVVVVCRGGDCGSRRKHPTLDHADQLRRIREGVGDDVTVTVSKCLDACERSNVVVVIPSARARIIDPSPVWIGELNDADSTDDVIEWVADGGPAVVAPPPIVDILRFSPTRMNRHELEDGAVTLPR